VAADLALLASALPCDLCVRSRNHLLRVLLLELHIVSYKPIGIVPELLRDPVTDLSNAGDLLVPFIHQCRFKLI
jgi:hypothetical protein